mmetsp:Transcript_50049/g.128818  ORF Transcript_50049/g.128818 Transcript_50049/m.128818 type:complete len:107 (-) Transcript_50049:460-780(-)
MRADCLPTNRKLLLFQASYVATLQQSQASHLPFQSFSVFTSYVSHTPYTSFLVPSIHHSDGHTSREAVIVISSSRCTVALLLSSHAQVKQNYSSLFAFFLLQQLSP